MTKDAETTRVLYFVEPHELVVLQGLESDVLSVLAVNKVEGRASWVNRIDADNRRFVQLWVATESQSTFLLEWLSSELESLSPDALRARLKESVGQR